MDTSRPFSIGHRRPSALKRHSRRGNLHLELERLESRTLLSGGTNPSTPMSIGMNLDFISWGSSAPMFADVMKMTADIWWVTYAATPSWSWNIPGVTLPPMDQNGYPIGLGNLPAQGYVLDTAVFQNGQHYPTGTYTLTFDGSGTVTIIDEVDDDQSFTQSGGLGTPFNVNVSGTSDIGLTIVIASSDPSDYVRNIRLVMPGCQNTYQTQPFNPQYLSALEPFSWLRFDDPAQIDSETQQVGMNWSDMTPVTYRTQTKSTGMSIEYIVDLCNTLHENMWVNMPVGSDDTFYSNYATYVLNNLDPGLKVYVEYGNEVWNWALLQRAPVHPQQCDGEWNQLRASHRESGVELLE